MEKVKKQVNLSKILIQYIFAFSIGTIALVTFFMILFQVGVNAEIILPANYYEKQIESQRDAIVKVEQDDDQILKQYKYVVYDFSGNVIQGSINKDYAGQIWNNIHKDEKGDSTYYYAVIERDKDICVILYTLHATFKNPFLQKYLPSPEVCEIVLFILLFVAEVIFLSRSFGKSLSKEMLILRKVTDKIQKEDLDFQVEQSKIKEVNEVLTSLVKMKDELNHSLRTQWNMETNRREQIVALAHDIKTPLTILRGNAELLNESMLDSNQKKCNEHILKSIDEMEIYMKSLLDITKCEEGAPLQFKQTDLHDFIHNIIEESAICVLGKQLNLIENVQDIPNFIPIDETALKRAIMNIMMNAIEYSPTKGDLMFSVEMISEKLQFIVEDSGRGFTGEEMHSATEQFYRGDKSRNSKDHHGMGLYIAKSFAKQHGGNLYLSNSEKLHGAKVVLEISA
ncbi:MULTISPECIES: sensor histidine kinase KdpD [unclassified Bacillus cereus group]|uniref:sensor histidine kinase n=1 Tax=Bacillus cereus group TaxID=86661 RepID=UPI001F591DA2|nr:MULTISPECIES: HAMP domain-containing sensor histidine kinase [unclassified Bacillus cereus group]MDA1542848.1 HAMP domain-containing sensor histidine kinase [Bacillus cereus group sp. TH253LC]MDA1579605.1 HAMP domain-containing sensor histidine kinase [Bacillus cereus group sp. TH228LC]MDA1630584.1 HAMP domain-containing sensor histidine kinase [Bacillus cereus group sp. TH172LC]MDA1835744.1 HAMP domain-containing sensor histidine kinase [Bacillus cereus group sp. BY17LC]